MPNLNEFINKPQVVVKQNLESIHGVKPCSKCDKNSEESFGIQSLWFFHGNVQMDMQTKLGWGKLNTDFSSIKKIVIAPQIVIYKNIFKNSKEIIDLLQDSRKISFFNEWRDWYGQGFRRDGDFSLLDTIDPGTDTLLNLEKEYILEINKCMNFIREDYLNEFGKENGIWPSFIKDWKLLKDTNKKYWIDFLDMM